MPYVLSPRQAKAFTGRFELYKITANGARTGTTKTLNGFYYPLTHDNVRGRIGQMPAVASVGRLGRTDADLVTTFDVLRLHEDQECDTGWYVRDKTTDEWYSVLGTAQARTFRARESTYKLARAEAPPILAGANPG